MTVEFIESFDHLTLAQLSRKWTSLSNTSRCRIVTGRTSSGFEVSAPNPGETRLSKTLASRSIWIVGFALKVVTLPPFGYWGEILGLSDAGTVQCLLRVNADGTLRHIRSSTGAFGVGSGTVLGAAPSVNALATDNWYYIEAKITVHNGSGACEVRVDGTSANWINISAIDNAYTANNLANSVTIGNLYSATYPIQCIFDDFYVIHTASAPNNDFLGDRRVFALYPEAAGNSAQWTIGGSSAAGTNWESVDETTPDDDVTEVHSGTTNQVDTHVFTDLGAGVGAVTAIQTNLIAKKDDVGVRSIAPVVRPVATDRVGTTVALTTTYADYLQVYDTNPETGSAWDKTEVNASEFGYKEIT